MIPKTVLPQRLFLYADKAQRKLMAEMTPHSMFDAMRETLKIPSLMAVGGVRLDLLPERLGDATG